MSDTTNNLENHGMPCTANRDFKADPRLLVKGEGGHYCTHPGRRILDGSAGRFCSAAGHGRRSIAEAVLPSAADADLSGWRIVGLLGVSIGGLLIYFGAVAL